MGIKDYFFKQTKKLTNAEEIGGSFSRMKEMTSKIKSHAPSKESWRTLKQHLEEPANYERFAEIEKQVGKETIAHNYRVHFWTFYLAFLGLMGCMVNMAFGSWFSFFPNLAFCLFFVTMMFRGSLFCFLINHRHLSGVSNWCNDPESWVPGAYEPVETMVVIEQDGREHFVEIEKKENRDE